MKKEQTNGLKSLSQVTERLSHNARTQLGVGIAAFDDLLNGVKLEKEDLEDGLTCLKKIVSLLEDAKIFSQVSEFELEELKASDLLNKLKAHPDLGELEITVDDSFKAEQTHTLSADLIMSAISSLLSYLKNHLKTPVQTLVLSSLGNSLNLSFSLPETDSKDLSTLIEKDHSPKAFKLIFAKEVFEAYGVNFSLNSL